VTAVERRSVENFAGSRFPNRLPESGEPRAGDRTAPARSRCGA
jgi:hypothetical protein